MTSRRADEVRPRGIGLALISDAVLRSFDAPVRESEQAECHRSPGDPVHRIPAQQHRRVVAL